MIFNTAWGPLQIMLEQWQIYDQDGNHVKFVIGEQACEKEWNRMVMDPELPAGTIYGFDFHSHIPSTT